MNNIWKVILVFAGIGLVIAGLTAGFLVPVAAVVLLLLVLGGGALLYRMGGPPER
jgi:hypothetical protein